MSVVLVFCCLFAALLFLPSLSVWIFSFLFLAWLVVCAITLAHDVVQRRRKSNLKTYDPKNIVVTFNGVELAQAEQFSRTFVTTDREGVTWTCEMEAEDDEGPECDHGIVFDEQRAKTMTTYEVRRMFPRLSGQCPKGCGYDGIGYASLAHYVYGDW